MLPDGIETKIIQRLIKKEIHLFECWLAACRQYLKVEYNLYWTRLLKIKRWLRTRDSHGESKVEANKVQGKETQAKIELYGSREETEDQAKTNEEHESQSYSTLWVKEMTVDFDYVDLLYINMHQLYSVFRFDSHRLPSSRFWHLLIGSHNCCMAAVELLRTFSYAHTCKHTER